MAYKQYNVKTKIVTPVADLNGTTNFGSISMNGGTAYCIKTNGANTKSTLYRLNDYKNKTATTGVFSNKLGHGNGSAYNNGSLWVATGKTDIIRIKPEESLSTPYTFTPASGETKYNISSISYYKNNKFIVKSRTLSEGAKLEYRIIQFSGTNKTYSVDKSEPTITVTNSKFSNGYDTTQDILYKSNMLYIILTKGENLTENAILVIDLAGTYSGSATNRVYTPKEVLIIKENSYTKFEVESLDVAPDGNLVMACNIEGNGKGDSIIKEVSRTLI